MLSTLSNICYSVGTYAHVYVKINWLPLHKWCYQISCIFDPSNVNAILMLAHTYEQRGDMKAFEQTLKKGIVLQDGGCMFIYAFTRPESEKLYYLENAITCRSCPLLAYTALIQIYEAKKDLKKVEELKQMSEQRYQMNQMDLHSDMSLNSLSFDFHTTLQKWSCCLLIGIVFVFSFFSLKHHLNKFD
jgi:hypothetical protein